MHLHELPLLLNGRLVPPYSPGKKKVFGRITLHLLMTALPSRKLLLPSAARLCGGQQPPSQRGV